MHSDELKELLRSIEMLDAAGKRICENTMSSHRRLLFVGRLRRVNKAWAKYILSLKRPKRDPNLTT